MNEFGWTEEDDRARARQTARAQRLLTTPITSGQRAGLERQAQARKFARRHFYPTNAGALEDEIVDEFVRTALQDGGRMDPDEHYLLLPEMGGVHLIQRNEDDAYSLLGQDVLNRPVQYVGPCADLDPLVRYVWRDQLPCYYCTQWTANSSETSEGTAALLPLPYPPHVVVMALCLTCTERLAGEFPGLHFVFRKGARNG